MTSKDPKDMTASELLRLAVDGYEGSKGTVIANLIDLMGLDGYEWHGRCLRRLADKIDAELTDARAEGISEGVDASLRAGAEMWAKVNGWPDFRDGEDFGAWLDRCAYKKPVDDHNEPVQFGDEIEIHHRDGDVDKGRFQEATATDGPVWVLSFTGVDHEHLYRYDSEFDTIKRPAPEVLGADGKPIVVGETVYSTLVEWLGTPLEVLGIENQAYVKVAIPGGKGWTSFIADNLTHTPPDTQEKIDRDKSKAITRYWECEDAECHTCPCRIDGKKPSEYYGTINCSVAQGMDIARRQAELDKRTGGAE
ncbi:hypothetical protein AALA69_03170 [Eggerthellaceae bacterium 24-137]